MDTAVKKSGCLGWPSKMDESGSLLIVLFTPGVLIGVLIGVLFISWRSN